MLDLFRDNYSFVLYVMVMAGFMCFVLFVPPTRRTLLMLSELDIAEMVVVEPDVVVDTETGTSTTLFQLGCARL